MANTIANVLTGVATLGVREPNNARAEWSTVQQYAGSQSVKLSKTGSGDAGSTHVEITITPSATITLTTVQTDPTDFSYWHYCNAVTGNFTQFELRFEDPNSDAWVEVTQVGLQSYLGTNVWTQESLAGADTVGIGGVNEIGTSFFLWDLSPTLGTIVTDIDTEAGGATSCGDWQLARVRVELWESEPARHCYIDSIEIDGTVYTVEPGGTAPALSLSSPYTDIGYTEDGVTLTYNTDTADIEVEEETVPIDRVITKESIEITCNMAESSLANMGFAMAGSLVSGSILKVGAGTLKTMNLMLEGLNPAGYKRQMFFPKCTATGSVGMPYKKGEKTVIPVTFQALKPASEAAFTVVDNAA